MKMMMKERCLGSELPYFVQHVVACLNMEKGMIARVKYTIRRALPGKNEYDYEVLEAEAIQGETDVPKDGLALLKEAMHLCRSNTAVAQAAKAAQSKAATPAAKE